MAQSKTDKKVGAGVVGGVTLGLAAVAAAAAGAYWLYGAEEAKKNRKQVKSFMLKSKAEVMDAVEKMKMLDKTAYLAVVDRVVAKYSAAAGVTASEVAQMTRELKAAWMHMKEAHDIAMAKAQPKVSAPAKKAAPKKVAKSA